MKGYGLLLSAVLCFSGPVAAAFPQITGVSPYFGDTAGGTEVVISGDGLGSVTQVLFGSTPATILSTSRHRVTVSAPAHAPQAVHVTVTNANGHFSPIGETDYFVYQGQSWVYAGMEDDSNVAVVDVNTLALYPLIDVGEGPGALFSTSDGTTVFTIND